MQYKPKYGARRQNSYNGARKRRSNKSRNTSGIPVHKFINKAVEPELDIPYTPDNDFHSFGLNSKIVTNLDKIGYSQPSEIQDRCIPIVLQGTDVIGLANTGTGKTAAFLLPIINGLIDSRARVSSLILAPTRELAQQIDMEFKKFAEGTGLYSTVVVGGVNIGKQIYQVKRGPHIIIGTPGRVKDLIGRKVLNLSNISNFVLDEADRMCDMGFVGDITEIAGLLPTNRQTLCYSATMTDKVKQIVEQFMTSPTTLSVSKNQTNKHIEQDVVFANDKQDKLDKLVNMLSNEEFEKVIIFGETKYGVQRLSDHLSKNDLPSVAIHGNKTQSQRNQALRKFKEENQINYLVATDVAARGIDVKDVTHVINFDPPKQYEDYVHRIGRTGRAGKTGKALTFVVK